MKFFDTHSHYYDVRFDEEANGADAILAELFSSSLGAAVNIGTNPDTSRAAIAQALRYPAMFTAVGIHPTDCQELTEPMDKALSDIELLARDPSSKCVAIGEIGLDYHYDDTDREKQLSYFHAQMELARSLGLPVSIHDREAHEDTLAVLKAHPGVRGILHSFSGSAEMARAVASLGYFVSFSGTLTFTNARKPREAAAVVPRELLLIETDCPYLAPHPLRGTLNHSGNLLYTNRALAGILAISEEECAALTAENAQRIFALPHRPDLPAPSL